VLRLGTANGASFGGDGNDALYAETAGGLPVRGAASTFVRRGGTCHGGTGGISYADYSNGEGDVVVNMSPPSDNRATRPATNTPRSSA
jgi:hypothetical protein